MPKVTFTRDGQPFQAEFTMEEFEKFAGLNGHASTSEESTPTVRVKRHQTRHRSEKSADQLQRFKAFYDELSDRARKCLDTIRLHPKGIDSHELAKSLGFKGPSQLGGLFGPGVRVIAENHGLRIRDIYYNEVTFQHKVRQKMFYPGKLLRAPSLEESEVK